MGQPQQCGTINTYNWQLRQIKEIEMAIYKRRKKSIAKKSRRSSKSSKRGVTKPRGRARGRGGR